MEKEIKSSIDRFIDPKENKRFRKHTSDKENLDKYLIKMNKELNNLYSARADLGKLEIKPYHDGYQRILIIKEEYKENKIANMLYPIIKNRIWCREKNFMKKDWGTKKKHEIKLYPKSLYPREYEKLSTDIQKYFIVETNRHGAVLHVLNTLYTKYFTHKQRKFYVNFKYIIDPKIEKRIDEIWGYIIKHNLTPRMDKILYGRHKYKDGWDYSKTEKIEKSMNKELQRFLCFQEDYNEHL